MTQATLRPFRSYKTGALTTYASDGVTGTDTPVSYVVDGDRVLFRTWEDSATAAQLRDHPVADLRPSSYRGQPCGQPVRGRVQLLEGPEARHASLLLQRRHPVLQRWAVPISQRLLRYRSLHYALLPFDRDQIRSNEGCPD
ncbi:PPOX class F420-dependent oxidoreductase [Nocardiopsis coralliicola]